MPIKIDDIVFDTRVPTPQDIPFIVDTWLESFRLAHAAGPIPMDMYRKTYREVIARLLTGNAPGVQAKCLVVFNTEIPNQIAGYVVYEDHLEIPSVHYVFTRHWIRRAGLARFLLGEAGIDTKRPFVYGFKSRIAAELVKHWTGAKFDPIDIRRRLVMHPEDE